jgi:murein DD-endopeptidase MepM/ murein hydrolase activator NlpD
MNGDDVEAWQQFLLEGFQKWNIAYPIIVDGDYGGQTRSATASFMRAWGVVSAQDAMATGLRPYWRSKLRGYNRSEIEQANFESDERKAYRAALRDRFEKSDVCYPVPNLITDDWGYHPGVHDGVDLMGTWKQPVLAICSGRIVRVSDSGWWGKGAHATAGHPVSDGDGIIILECLVEAGPFKRGMHFGYGHTEPAVVEEGQYVKAGTLIGRMGWANGAHVHFMVNDDAPVDHFYSGRGDRDPMPFLDYAN